MQQNLGGYKVDLLTPGELSGQIDRLIGEFRKTDPRGVKLMRTPIARFTATAATGIISAGQGNAPMGPEQGYIWRLTRLIVASNSATDAATYTILEGSDPTDTSQIRIVDAPLTVNHAYTPGSRAVYLLPGEQLYANLAAATAGNTYTMRGLIVEAPAEMIAKIL